MKKYIDLLQDAKKATEAMGLGFEDFSPNSSSITNSEIELALMEAMSKSKYFKNLAVVDIACRCAEVHLNLKLEFEEIFGRKVMLTLGDLRYNEVGLIEIPNFNFASLRKSGIYHVWWTLSSGQIIDITLISSIKYKKGIEVEGVHPIIDFPENSSPFAWIPRLVGDEAIHRLLYSH